MLMLLYEFVNSKTTALLLFNMLLLFLSVLLLKTLFCFFVFLTKLYAVMHVSVLVRQSPSSVLEKNLITQLVFSFICHSVIF